MSGHNKWSQIKHKKGKEDARRGKIFSLLSRQITMEAKKAGGDKNAPGVKAAIERARKDNMPNDNIDRAIAKAVGAGSENYEEVTYEAYGPGGAAIIIEGITDSKNRATQEIKHLLSEQGGNLGNQGSVIWAFNRSGANWQPKNYLTLGDAETDQLIALLEKISDHPDIKNIYTNVAGISD